ncbi:MAG: hypothetical protein MMC33_008999 [Icmadophila ericetorum]|nr:hypothetical protein [Icmadophila ericetorum]
MKIESTHSKINKEDVDVQLSIEKRDSPANPEASAKEILSFEPGDPDNPHNWSNSRKSWIVFIGILGVLNSTFNSALPSGATEPLNKYFHVTNQQQIVLPISLYLVGYILGPLFFGPLSETYGRRIILIISFALFTIFALACAVAPNWPSFLLFRFILGTNAASAVTVTGGLYADVYSSPISRGRAMALFMTATCFGPDVAPSVSGFASVVSWRLPFYIAFAFAGVSMIFLFFLPETYAPVILQNRAKKLRAETGNPNIFAPLDLEKKGAKQMLTITLTRPLRMLFFEAIVLCSCLYLALIYAIFYLFFEAYPLVYQGTYGMNAGEEGLAFLPIPIGACLAFGIFLYYDRYLQRAKRRKAEWAFIEEYQRLPLACLGGPLYVVALFWLAWSARTDVPWIIPMLAGIPFGIGFLLIFMALLNYLTDAYQIFAASAMAASTCSRSIFGAVLPLAAEPMYGKLGVPWASSLLGFLSLLMCVIPFVFIKYGDRIRARSKFCQYLAEKNKAEEEEERKRNRSRGGITANSSESV